MNWVICLGWVIISIKVIDIRSRSGGKGNSIAENTAFSILRYRPKVVDRVGSQPRQSNIIVAGIVAVIILSS